MIQTVLGPIEAGELGVTSMHEHLLADARILQAAAREPLPESDRVTVENLGFLRWNLLALEDNLVLDDAALAIEELGWAVALNQDKQDAIGHLNAASDSLAAVHWQSEVDRLESSRNAKFWFAGATMLLSVIDAYVDAHLRGFDKRIDATVGYVPEVHGAGVALRTRWD